MNFLSPCLSRTYQCVLSLIFVQSLVFVLSVFVCFEGSIFLLIDYLNQVCLILFILDWKFYFFVCFMILACSFSGRSEKAKLALSYEMCLMLLSYSLSNSFAIILYLFKFSLGLYFAKRSTATCLYLFIRESGPNLMTLILSSLDIFLRISWSI